MWSRTSRFPGNWMALTSLVIKFPGCSRVTSFSPPALSCFCQRELKCGLLFPLSGNKLSLAKIGVDFSWSSSQAPHSHSLILHLLPLSQAGRELQSIETRSNQVELSWVHSNLIEFAASSFFPSPACSYILLFFLSLRGCEVQTLQTWFTIEKVYFLTRSDQVDFELPGGGWPLI